MKLRTAAALGLISVLTLAGCGSSGGESGGGLSNSSDSGSDAQEASGEYSAGPVELIVPFAPGGGADFTGRTIAQFLEPEVGESVTVVNVDGAGGQVGATELSTMSPDGQSIGLMSAGVLTTLPATRDTAYDLKSFDIIGKVAVSRQVLQIQADAPWKSVDDLVTYAKDNPGELTYGTSGVASTAHLAMAMFLQEAGIEAEHVVYGGLGPAKTDLMGGNIDAVIGPVTDSDESRIRPLVSFSAERGATSQNIPLLADSGYNTSMDVIHYLVAPAGTPKPTLDFLEESLKAASENPETADAFGSSELEISFSDSESSAEQLKDYEELTMEVVDNLGIQE
jgi:tripartite-type tricarboxylate transporter receptor subunit TctC